MLIGEIYSRQKLEQPAERWQLYVFIVLKTLGIVRFDPREINGTTRAEIIFRTISEFQISNVHDDWMMIYICAIAFLLVRRTVFLVFREHSSMLLQGAPKDFPAEDSSKNTNYKRINE